MAEAGETKICRLCAETIKAAAFVCPYCRHPQNRWSFRNPQVGIAISMVIMFLVLFCVSEFFDAKFGPKEQFSAYRNQIVILHSEFSQKTAQSNLWNSVVGILTNQSDVCWKDVGVEAQFFDRSGKMIDAITVNDLSAHQIVILPHGEAAFKIEGKASNSPEDYWTNKLNVRWARDEKSLF